MGVNSILCERSAAGVLDTAPYRTVVSWVTPALVVGGRRSTGQTNFIHALSSAGILLSRKSRALAWIRPSVPPVWHVQVVPCEWAHLT